MKCLSIGERALVRTSDAITGVEYTLPCTVAWAYRGNPCIMGLMVDGVPTRSEIDPPTATHPMPLFSMGKQTRLEG